MNDIITVAQEYETHAKALGEANTINKIAVFDALIAASITSVIVTFDGGGDNGQIGEITAHAGDSVIPLPRVLMTMQHPVWKSGELEPSQILLQDAIETLCFHFLSERHGGWENNEGGCGDFTFHVDQRKIELDFTEYFTESRQHLHTF